MSTTHMAGIDVTIDGRYLRQRCAWCDEIIIDVDLTAIAVALERCADCNPGPGQGRGDGCRTCDGSGYMPPAPFSAWPIGGYVRRDGGMTSVVETADGKMPDDSCARRELEVKELTEAIGDPKETDE